MLFDTSDPDFSGAMKQIWKFVANKGGTRVSVACENVPQGIGREDHAVGLNDSLANLARIVEDGI